jgi:DNA-binding NtrC family response regulator
MAGGLGNELGGVVRRLRRIHVLVVSEDQAFLRAATDRLRREGFFVDCVRCQSPPREELRRSRADVVLLDHAGSLGETLRAIAAVEACAPHVAVVVAAEVLEIAAALNVPLVARSSSGHRVAEAVERAYLRRQGSGDVPADAV